MIGTDKLVKASQDSEPEIAAVCTKHAPKLNMNLIWEWPTALGPIVQNRDKEKCECDHILSSYVCTMLDTTLYIHFFIISLSSLKSGTVQNNNLQWNIPKCTISWRKIIFFSKEYLFSESFHTQLQKLGLYTYKWMYLFVCMYRQEKMLFFVACMKIQVTLDQFMQKQKTTFPGIRSLMGEAFKSLHEKRHKQSLEDHVECVRNKC